MSSTNPSQSAGVRLTNYVTVEPNGALSFTKAVERGTPNRLIIRPPNGIGLTQTACQLRRVANELDRLGSQLKKSKGKNL